jgi:DNA-binding NarL/FixJ family response regulator
VVRILLADDHSLFRDGLRSLLTANGHDVVAEARNGREAVQLARSHHPDIVLMDLSMPELNGLEATKMIAAELRDVKVIILTASDDDANLFEAIKCGAQGYLLKNLEADDLLGMLDRAAENEPALTPVLARKLLQEFAKPTGTARAAISDDDPDALTAREREVLVLMVEGFTSNRRLAKRLALSENTVKFHVRNILDKLHLHNRAEVVAFALRNKIV